MSELGVAVVTAGDDIAADDEDEEGADCVETGTAGLHSGTSVEEVVEEVADAADGLVVAVVDVMADVS